jgi:hypothetical protein
MTDAQRRYVRTEMIVAAIINAILSIVFMLIMFGGQQTVAVSGRGGLVVDAVPQTLMIALMSTLVPTILTRRRIAMARIAPLLGSPRWPRNVLMRSGLVASGTAAIAWILHAIVMPPIGPIWPFLPALVFKVVYGAILGATISRYAVTAALKD